MTPEERALLRSVLENLLAEEQVEPAPAEEPPEAPPPELELPSNVIPLWEVVAEKSNPGPVGFDTGYVFNDPVTGQPIRVIAEIGQSREDAITETRCNHGLDGCQRLEQFADEPPTGETK